MTGLKVLATGRYTPAKIMTNEDFVGVVETSDEWITARTGIKERRYCEWETNTDLALAASRQAIERAGIDPADIGAVIVATFTPDHGCPVTACLLQRGLRLSTNVIAFDMNAGCTGFLFALDTAYSYLLRRVKPYALVVGSEYMTRVTNFEDRSTCVLFGDGAGAAVVGLADGGMYYSVTGAEGNEDYIYVQGPAEERVYIKMDGNPVFRFATGVIPRCVDSLLEQSGLALDDIDWFVCHQANKRIIDHVRKKLGVPEEKFYCNIERFGNTSAASIPIALDELNTGGRIKPGQRVMFLGFGGGLTWGGALIEW